MLRRVKQPNEGDFLNVKACYLLIWTNKQLGHVISKDVIRLICKRYLVCVCYAEYCFHAKFGKEFWDNTTWKVFSSMLTTRVNEFQCANRSDTDQFVFALSCSLIACNYPVRIVWFENGHPFTMVDNIATQMGLDVKGERYHAIEQKSMSMKSTATITKIYFARKLESKPLLRWQTIENY
jgi:hypothetical protein